MKSRAVFFGLILLVSCASETNDANESENGGDTGNGLHELEMDQGRISAVEFNNDLILMQNDVLDMRDILFTSDSASVETNLDNMLFELDIKLDILAKKKFDGTELAFVAAMKDLMNFYRSEVNTGFREILPLMKITDPSQSDLDKLDAYDRDFTAKEKAAFEKVFDAQDAFAKEHKISLE